MRSTGKLCVLIIVENLPVPLDRRVWQEACALRDAGYEVVVICPKMRGFMEGAETLDGIHIYRHWISIEARGVLGFLGEYFSALFGEIYLTWKVWLRYRFHIIHLCNPPDILFLVAIPFKLFGVRVVYDVHDLWPEMFEAKFQKRGLLYQFVRIAERLTHACADVVIATNGSVKDIAIARGGKSLEQVFVVRTAPKIDHANISVDPALKRGRPFLIGYVGVMGSTDGVDYILEAAHHLIHKLKRTDVQFLLMGSGSEFEFLLQSREKLRIADYVEMPGRVSNEFLFRALQTMDIGVASDPRNSYNDHCTMNKVLEYMTFGKPQVMFDLKEGRESARDAAVYVPENSAEKLADALNQLLDDPGARHRLGQIGLQRMQTVLNWERSVEQLLAAYAATGQRLFQSADDGLLTSRAEKTAVNAEIRPGAEAHLSRAKSRTPSDLNRTPLMCQSREFEHGFVLGSPLTIIGYQALIDLCIDWAKNPRVTALDFANTHVVTLRRQEPSFRMITDTLDYLIPDGMPLIWCLNLKGARLKDRVYGPTFMRRCIVQSGGRLTHYFLGGSVQCLARLKESLQKQNPALAIAGSYDGFCSNEGVLQGDHDDRVIDEINRLSPDMIWIGLGTPKQHAWINRNKSRIHRGLLLGVGFAFDVNAGTKPDAPLWMQRLGLTWVFRLASEPRRLFFRYLRYNSLFLFYLLWDGIRGKAFTPGPR